MSTQATELHVFDAPRIDGRSIEQWLIERIARYVQMEPGEIEPDRPLDEIGLDSVYALAMCGEIEEALHCPVEPTIAWDFPTVAQIAGELRRRLAEQAETPATTTSRAA